jgi:hypothetical protein
MAVNTLQPSAPFNEAMQRLDAISPLLVQDNALTAPPTTADTDAGKRWIVGAAATDAWAGQDNNVALCTGANLWVFIPPWVGLRAYIFFSDAVALNKYYRWNSTAWVDDSAAGAVTEAPEDGKGYVRKDGAWVEENPGLVATVDGVAPDANGVLVLGAARKAQPNQFTDQQAVTPYRASVSGDVAIDLSVAKSNNLHLTLSGNVTSFALTNPMDGAVYNIRWIQDATGGRTVAGLPTSFKFAGGTAPTFSTDPDAVDFMSLQWGVTEGTYMASFLQGVA